MPSQNQPDRPSDINQSPTGERPENADRELPAAAGNSNATREELTRKAAYRRWEARGSEHGGHEEDWSQAEKDLEPPAGN